MNSYLALFRTHPAFRWLWLAQVISLFGDWFNTVALLGLVAQFTDQSGLAASGLLIARSLPPFIVSPIAGVLVDRFDRKKLLIWSDVLRACIGVALFFANSPERLWIIYAATVLQFSISAIFEPSRSALVPRLVSAENLVQANALSNITWSVMLAVGALIGGVVTAVFGTSAALLVDAASFVLSAFCISRIRMTKVHAATDETSVKDGGGFRDGLRYVRNNPQIGAVLLVKFGLSIGSVDTIMNAYATTRYVIGENGSGSLGLLFGAFGIGSILGPLLMNRFTDKSVASLQRLLVWSFACVSVGWFLIGLSGSLEFLMLAVMVRAMGGSATWTYSSTLIQIQTNDRFMGRVFSLDWLAFYLAITVSIFLIGAFLDMLGNEAVSHITFVIAALSLLPLGFWVFAVRWLERRRAIVTPA
ncbi:MAG: MFS transporter [Anaerolineae bacterium]